MGCTCPPVCKAAMSSATHMAPGRSTASDGCCASGGHHAQNPNSDHEPGRGGFAHAVDITHDVQAGFDSWLEADRLRMACKLGVEKRVKYVISNRRIASRIDDWEWRRYSGANAHAHHMHISVVDGYELSTEPWFDYPFDPRDGQPRNPGTTAPLPVVLVTDHPEEHMRQISTRIALDLDGNGYTDLPGVAAKDVVSVVVNGADPATAGGYPDHGIDLHKLQVAGVTRVVAFDGPSLGAVDIDVWCVA